MTTVGSLCSGYEGLGEAVCAHYGATIAWQSEVDPAPCKVLEAHYPGVPNLGDLTTVDWSGVEPVDVLCAGYPCFAAGTIVHTDHADVPVEQVRVGDLALTHERRYRPVTAIMRRDGAEVVQLKATGVPLTVTTPEHPYWARKRYRFGHYSERRFTEPEWVQAGELTKDHFIALPVGTVEPLPQLFISDQRLGVPLAYVIGRWLGDGWIFDAPRRHRADSRWMRVTICCAHHEADVLAERIQAAGYHATRSVERTVTKFHISNKQLVHDLADFGRGAAGKRLPGWVYDLSAEEKQALLDGWIDADGHYTAPGWEATTVSRALAIGMARLCRELGGHSASILTKTPPTTTTIEGRVVNQRPWYSVRSVRPTRTPVGFIEGGMAWVQVKSVTPLAEPTTVFNIAVDEDESYTANGAVVHNCQPFSTAGKRKGTADVRHLWPYIADAVRILRPRTIVLENVRGHLSLGFDRVLADLAGLGFDARWGVVRASDAGAPHRRERLFVVATDANGSPRDSRSRLQGSGSGLTRPGLAASGRLAADAHGAGPESGRGQEGPHTGSGPVQRRVVAHPERGTAQLRRGPAVVAGQAGAAEGEGHQRERGWDAVGGGGEAAAHAALSAGREPQCIGMGATGGRAAELGERLGAGGRVERADDAATRWGPFGPAIGRWAVILGRPAPDPLVGRQLNAVFVEWMQGLDEGWVTGKSIGLSNRQALKVLGNGVVPQQARLALELLDPAMAVAA